MRNYLYKGNSARIYRLFKFYRTAINWYILLLYVVFVSSIATAASRKMTDFSECMEVLMLMVLLYFLLSLSIQLVVYMHLCTWAGKSMYVK